MSIGGGVLQDIGARIIVAERRPVNAPAKKVAARLWGKSVCSLKRLTNSI
jgi:hypothetical protein